MPNRQQICIVILMTLVSTFAMAKTPLGEARDPEAATGTQLKSSVKSEKFMVAAANPYAVEAGYRVLSEGGSAVDAAIAVQMVLTLVEPQSSGIGGGAFLLHWDNNTHQLTSWDGRETAPSAATSALFIDSKGQPMNWWDALAGGRSVGAPGVLAVLAKAHQKYGKRPWQSLFKEAIALSENGFIVSERLHLLVAKKTNPALGRYDTARDYFYPDGEPLKSGALLRNPQLAATLKTIAAQGSKAFYSGAIAKDIIASVQGANDNPGLLTEADLASYQAKERPPICAPYHHYKVCGMGPPTSGGIAVLQILALLEPFNLSAYEPMSPDAIHLFSQASRLAYADRDNYIADSDFVNVPVEGLLDSDYLKQRSSLINIKKDMGIAPAGNIPSSTRHSKGQTLAQPSTSHISIVDPFGSAVSMTSSIEMAFGSTLMTRGFLLNNQLTDFSFRSKKEALPIANRVEGNKRPRSSMSPIMVFDQNNQLLLVIGSPGGSRIINYVAKSIIGILDWKLDIQRAIDLPNITNRNGTTDIELDTSATNLKQVLENRGHTVKIRELNSGLHGILVTPQSLIGGADSRREGIAKGL
ncbi:gamma-glutamyltransferase [Alkalimarinus alittae]|uniref:Glutathione hydrolase proenzyme n=1 Tax=Alkalimarinus alittae TaxID=2961619 RepID=A0ABY6N459_9ALTE|nr:gamma-glutamyltransferase [Alkalimarinus alittae]UZE96913.1 gamma-glutamyltransferase [Alkalimarinus alittae]